jgi:hypothetical protein
MRAWRRQKKYLKPLRRIARRVRRTRRIPKRFKRYVRSAVRNSAEPKKNTVSYVDNPIPIGLYNHYGQELTARIKQGFDRSERVGRKVHLTGIKFKRSVVAYPGTTMPSSPPLHFKWFIGQWKGSPDVTSAGILANMKPWMVNGEPEFSHLISGAKRTFATINTREWNVLMAGSQLFSDEHSNLQSAGRRLGLRSSYKKMFKTLEYSKTIRQVDISGEDYFQEVEADKPIYLFCLASRPDNIVTDDADALALHYEMTLYFRDP